MQGFNAHELAVVLKLLENPNTPLTELEQQDLVDFKKGAKSSIKHQLATGYASHTYARPYYNDDGSRAPTHKCPNCGKDVPDGYIHDQTKRKCNEYWGELKKC
jgi:hypothetical protein